MIRIAIVDDHPVVREGLVAALESDFEIVIAAGSADDLLHELDRGKPEVILLDLDLAGTSAITLLPRIRERASEARVVILSAYGNEEEVIGTVRAGASGYLLKGSALAEIARAIRTVHEGGTVFDPRVARALVHEVRGATRLSARETEVLRRVSNGESNKEIAAALSITERTVKFHVTSILGKLGAENRAQAAAMAVQRRLV